MNDEEHRMLKEKIYNTVVYYADGFAGEDGATAMKALGWELHRFVDQVKRQSDAEIKQGKEQ